MKAQLEAEKAELTKARDTALEHLKAREQAIAAVMDLLTNCYSGGRGTSEKGDG
jgi:hypothetical protein